MFLSSNPSSNSTTTTTTPPHLPLIPPLLPLLPPHPLHPLSPPLTSNPFAIIQLRLLPHLLLVQLNQPIPFAALVLALIPPFLDPLAALLIIHHVLAALVTYRAAGRVAAKLANALFASKVLPLGGRFGFREG